MTSRWGNADCESAPLKVAVVEPVGCHGGMDYYDFGLCHGLAGAMAQTVLFTSDQTPQPPQADFTVTRVYRDIFGSGHALGRGFRFLRGTVAAVMSARCMGAHIVHFHLFNSGPLEYFNVFLAKFAGLPVAITAHDVESLLSDGRHRRRTRFLYRRANIVIAHNEVSRKELFELIGSDREIAVIPHGNYVSDYDPALTKVAARDRLGLDPDAPIALFFGQIKTVKGLDILLQAWASVVAREPGARLVIAGRPWKVDIAGISEQIVESGIADSVLTRLEYIPAADAIAYYAAADVIVLPYRKIYQSGVLLMAMSLKTPVLASDIAGMAEIIDSGENGIMFRSGDSDDLAEKLLDLVSDVALRERLSEAAFADMHERFDWADIGRLTAAAFKRTVGMV